jgi:hypothetical protein
VYVKAVFRFPFFSHSQAPLGNVFNQRSSFVGTFAYKRVGAGLKPAPTILFSSAAFQPVFFL